MKFDLVLPNKGHPYGGANMLIEFANQTEESGWEGFFLWDHLGTIAEPPR